MDTPFVKFTRLRSLSVSDGGHPRAPVIVGTDGRLCGTSWQNGPNDGGGMVDHDADPSTLDVFKSASSNYYFIAQDLKDKLAAAKVSLAAPETIAEIQAELDARLDVNRKRCPGTVWSCAKNGLGFRLEHAFSQLDDAWRNADGYQPISPLVELDGWIYGTANQGGRANLATNPASTVRGTGTAFRFRPCQPETFETLHSFGSQSRFNDGAIPSGAVVPDGLGGFFVVPQKGSDFGNGVIARLIPAMAVEQVARFPATAELGPRLPLGAPVRVGPILYGWTVYGGAHGNGCVYAFHLVDGTFETIYSFPSNLTEWNKDNSPLQSLLVGSDGNLYGTHQHAGAEHGSGVVFRIMLPSGEYEELHAFGPRNLTPVRFANEDGALPLGTLVEDRYGNLYGTTSMGGAFGHGTIFQMSRDGSQFVTLHSFGYGVDGHHPHAGLVISGSQAFGTCFAGGDTVDVNGQGGFGVVYAITLPGAVPAKTGVEPGVLVESDPIRVGCLSAPTIKTTAPAEYSVNGGVWQSASGPLAPGDEIRIRRMSSTTPGKRELATYTLGFGQTGSFAVTTR